MTTGLQRGNSKRLTRDLYDTRLVELVIPNVPLSAEQIEVLRDLLSTGKISVKVVK